MFVLTIDKEIKVCDVVQKEPIKFYQEKQTDIYGNKKMPFCENKVIKESDNLGDLIEYQYQVDEDNVVYNIISTRGVDDKDRKLLIADTNDRIIGLIRIGDDLVKVAEWDNEKMEWKLYER